MLQLQFPPLAVTQLVAAIMLAGCGTMSHILLFRWSFAKSVQTVSNASVTAFVAGTIHLMMLIFLQEFEVTTSTLLMPALALLPFSLKLQCASLRMDRAHIYVLCSSSALILSSLVSSGLLSWIPAMPAVIALLVTVVVYFHIQSQSALKTLQPRLKLIGTFSSVTTTLCLVLYSIFLPLTSFISIEFASFITCILSVSHNGITPVACLFVFALNVPERKPGDISSTASTASTNGQVLVRRQTMFLGQSRYQVETKARNNQRCSGSSDEEDDLSREDFRDILASAEAEDYLCRVDSARTIVNDAVPTSELELCAEKPEGPAEAEGEKSSLCSQYGELSRGPSSVHLPVPISVHIE